MTTLRRNPANKLLEAARVQDWSAVEEMIVNKTPADVNETVNEGLDKGKSALFYAAEFGRWDIVKLMLDAFPDLTYDAKATPELESNFSPLSFDLEIDSKNPLWYAIAAGRWVDAKRLAQKSQLHRMDCVESLKALFEKFNNEFDYDWNDISTHASSKRQYANVEAFLATITKSFDSALIEAVGESAGQLYYKVGTYKLHHSREADAEYLFKAERILIDDQLAWTRSQIAFAYQKQLAQFTAVNDSNLKQFNALAKKTIESCDVLLSDADFDVGHFAGLDKDAKYEFKSFTLAVRALAEYEATKKVPKELKSNVDLIKACKDEYIDRGIKGYEIAIEIHKRILNQKGFQLRRMQARLAMMYDERGRVDDAELLFGELLEFWDEQSDFTNPYGSRFYEVYGDFLINQGDFTNAWYAYGSAFKYQVNTDGIDSPFTIKVAAKLRATALIKNISIHRENVHETGVEIADDIAELRSIFAEHMGSLPAKLLKEVARTLMVYDTFFARDRNAAPISAANYVALTKSGTLENLEARTYLSFSQTIDGGFKDGRQFKANYDALIELEKTTTDAASIKTIKMLQAFNLRYVGLMYHRNGNYSAALGTLKDTLRLQEELIGSDFPIELDLAETHHIISVILTQMSKLTPDDIKSNNMSHILMNLFSLEEAEKELNLAADYWNQFEFKTDHTHPIQMITEQAFVTTWIEQSKNPALEMMRQVDPMMKLKHAMDKGKQTAQRQVNYFSTEIHADVGKTLHFLAEAYATAYKFLAAKNDPAANENYTPAVMAYDETLRVKEALLEKDRSPVKDRFMVMVTEKAKADFLAAVKQLQEQAEATAKATETATATQAPAAKATVSPIGSPKGPHTMWGGNKAKVNLAQPTQYTAPALQKGPRG